MRNAFGRIAVVALIAMLQGAPRIAEAGNITYSIVDYAADQNGASLAGTITTDGVIGTLTSPDILSWSWTITPVGGVPFTYSSSDANATSNIVGAIASQSNITIALPLQSTDFHDFALFNGQTAMPQLDYARSIGHNLYFGSTLDGIIWNDPSPSMGGTDPWVIAVAAGTIPEPSTVTLLGIAAAGLVVAARRRASRRVG